MRRALLTALALLAFAANSVLCRLALIDGSIDPASFTTVRLASGAIVLLVLLRLRSRGSLSIPWSWRGAGLLALYALPFALAYRQLGAGTGALLLFGAVQCTMILGGYREGHRLAVVQWFGLAVAFAGLIYLVAPGVSAPPPLGASLMLLAGASWGLYSLLGRTIGGTPLARTAGNFLRATPVAILVTMIGYQSINVSTRGLLLATASGGIASGLGYVIWYQVLPELSAVTASIVQLAVPLIAAAGGAVLIGERLTLRLGVATVLVLAGISAALLGHRPNPGA